MNTNSKLSVDFFSVSNDIWEYQVVWCNIFIHDKEVELYFQHYTEPHEANGIWSLTLEKWIAEPVKLNPEIIDKVEKEKDKQNESGMDNVKFLVSMNKGGSKGEIHKVSSGGELSRLMLAINLVIAKSMNKKTLVFDEVDSGVSGSVAEAIAIRLLNLSKTQQILIVTHLPQVAARGQQHFKTSKSSKNNITVTGVKELSYEDRVEEVASMISGDQITDEARLLSERLLNHTAWMTVLKKTKLF